MKEISPVFVFEGFDVRTFRKIPSKKLFNCGFNFVEN